MTTAEIIQQLIKIHTTPYVNSLSMRGRKISFENESFFFSNEELQPDYIKEMIILAKRLSTPFPHCRVDFYYVDKRILVGELTFFHQAGNEIFPNLAFEKFIGSFFDYQII
jgi:hypothetical protein